MNYEEMPEELQNLVRTARLYGGIELMQHIQNVLLNELQSLEEDTNSETSMRLNLDGVSKELQIAQNAGFKAALEIVQSIELVK